MPKTGQDVVAERSQPQTVQSGASPQYTTRNDLSLLSRCLQRLIKPFRPRLVAPPRKRFPAGSPIISPIPEPLTRKCNVQEQNVAEVWTYSLTSRSQPQSTKNAKRHIYYFSGGGFQNIPTTDHFKLLAELCRRLGSDAQLHVVSYPLAPSSPAAESLRILRLWLEEVLSQAAEQGSTVSLAGDSSGGNIAITLAIAATGGWRGSLASKINASPGPQLEASGSKWIDTDIESPLTQGRSKHVHALTNVFLLCPASDMRNDNPEMEIINHHDPILTTEFTGTVASIWCGSMDGTAHPSAVRALSVRKAPERPAQLETDDPRVSPVLADMSGLAECKIRVDGLIAGHDVLSPDGKILVKKLQEAGVPGEWQYWEHMMHCWPLTWWARVPEAVEALEWMVQKLGERGVQSEGVEQEHI